MSCRILASLTDVSITKERLFYVRNTTVNGNTSKGHKVLVETPMPSLPDFPLEK